MPHCDHTLAHKPGGVTDPPVMYHCDLPDKGHITHQDQFNRVIWKVDRNQTPQPTAESGRRVVWSTDVEWRKLNG